MEKLHRTISSILSGGFWPSLVIMTVSGLEFGWLEHVLGDELIAALLTIMTPLPFAPLLSRVNAPRR